MRIALAPFCAALVASSLLVPPETPLSLWMDGADRTVTFDGDDLGHIGLDRADGRQSRLCLRRGHVHPCETECAFLAITCRTELQIKGYVLWNSTLFRVEGQERSAQLRVRGESGLAANVITSLLANTRRKRSTGEAGWRLRVLVVTDESMDAHYDNDDAALYVLAIMSDVARIFEEGSLGHHITVSVARVLQLQTDVDSGLQVVADAKETLTNFCAWQKEHVVPDEVGHNVALLVTRTDLCAESSNATGGGEACSTLGLAELGSICKPDRACIVSQDNGLTVAHTIAHELGHVLNIGHDSEEREKGGDCSASSGRFVMSPTLETDVRRLSWSPCSRSRLDDFLASGHADCLLGDESAEQQANATERSLHIGALFDADQQCRFKFGVANATACNVGKPEDFCLQLWCRLGSNDLCVSHGDPPAAGTACAARSWCESGRCVAVDSQPAASSASAVHGQWGEWSAWSACSSSCGAAVRSGVRRCDNPAPRNGGRFCAGPNKRHGMCRTSGECANDDRRLDDEEVLRRVCRDTVTSGSTVQASTSDQNPCQIQCIVRKGEVQELVYTLAADGMLCSSGRRAVCVSGRCLRVGCDGRLNSQAEEDKCGRCVSDGRNCTRIEGHSHQVEGEENAYAFVATIPSGAKHVIVAEDEETVSTSFIALVFHDEPRQSILNGDYRIQWPGNKTIGNQMRLSYAREMVGGGSHRGQRVHVAALSRPIDVLLLKVGSSASSGVRWSYYISDNDSEVHSKLYSWRYTSFGPCSATCGHGMRTSAAVCAEADGDDEDLLEAEDPRSCAGPRPAPLKEACRVQACPPRWWAGPWQRCSVTCGPGGTRIRSVLCVVERQDSRVAVDDFGTDGLLALDDSLCDAGERPSAVQEECGMQLAACGAVEGMSLPSVDNEWTASAWLSSCGSDCAVTIQLRRVSCQREDVGCRSSPKPASYRWCHNATSCLSWTVGPWSDCADACANTVRPAVRRRPISCPLPKRFCSPSARPNDTEDCACPSMWWAGQWEDCSVTCGWGVQRRSVGCSKLWLSADRETDCEPNSRPLGERECVVEEECPAVSTFATVLACENELGHDVCKMFKRVCKTNKYFRDKCCKTCSRA